MADARGEREAAIKDLNIVAGEFEIDPIPVRSKQSDIEAFWKKLISSIQLIRRLHSNSLEHKSRASHVQVETFVFAQGECHFCLQHKSRDSHVQVETCAVA